MKIIFAIVGALLIILFTAQSSHSLGTQILPILCLDRTLFNDTVGKKQSLYLIATMPTSNHILEMYRGSDLRWTFVARNPFESQICVIASGDQLIDADWFIEKGLP
jgi:hypothetical protein